jgi:glucose dehydrogenase
VTVQQLMQILSQCPKERLVILARDREGNDYSPLDDVRTDNTDYVADTTWSGQIGLRRLTADDRASGYTEEDVARGGVPCVVLRPVS